MSKPTTNKVCLRLSDEAIAALNEKFPARKRGRPKPGEQSKSGWVDSLILAAVTPKLDRDTLVGALAKTREVLDVRLSAIESALQEL